MKRVTCHVSRVTFHESRVTYHVSRVTRVRFEPQYEDVARILRGEVSVGKINCEKYSKMCNKASVRGYPTLRYYRGRADHRAGELTNQK